MSAIPLDIFNENQINIIKSNKETILSIHKDLNINIIDLEIVKNQLPFDDSYSIKYDSNFNTIKTFHLFIDILSQMKESNLFVIDELDCVLHTKNIEIHYWNFY